MKKRTDGRNCLLIAIAIILFVLFGDMPTYSPKTQILWFVGILLFFISPFVDEWTAHHEEIQQKQDEKEARNARRRARHKEKRDQKKND